MTTDERAALSKFLRWVTVPARIQRLREVTAAAWRAKVPDIQVLQSPEGEDHAARAARQYLCSLIDQYETEQAHAINAST